MHQKTNILEAAANIAESLVEYIFKSKYPELNKLKLHEKIWVDTENVPGKIVTVYTEEAQDIFNEKYEDTLELLMNCKVE